MAATAELSAAPARRRDRGVGMPRLAAACVLLGGWQALALSGLLFRDVVPPLQTVAAGLLAVVLSAEFWRNAAVTAAELGAAMLIGCAAGLLVGLPLGRSPFLSRAYERWLDYLGPTPKIVLFPVLIMLCGVGPGSKVAMGAVSCFFPVAITVASGVRGVDPVLLRVGRSFRAGTVRTLTKIILPAMAAPLVNGVRLGFGVALVGVLLAETKLSNQGVGFLVIQAYSRFDMPRMYALLILAVVFAAAVNVGAERAALRLGGQRKR
jgi:ABC-type nitrate/sulfonate/bicarbonate transport system permease component